MLPKPPRSINKPGIGGRMKACSNLGILYLNGNGVTQDAAKGLARFQQACTNLEMAACCNFGMAYANGIGVTKDSGKAAALYQQACMGGHMKDCPAWDFV